MEWDDGWRLKVGTTGGSSDAADITVGVIGNAGATTFDIVWTETGTHTRGVYMWEAQ
jgi:hypothetical protein